MYDKVTIYTTNPSLSKLEYYSVKSVERNTIANTLTVISDHNNEPVAIFNRENIIGYDVWRNRSNEQIYYVQLTMQTCTTRCSLNRYDI